MRVRTTSMEEVLHGKCSPTVFRSETCTQPLLFSFPLFRNRDRIPPTCTSHYGPTGGGTRFCFIFLANPVFLGALSEAMMRRRSSTPLYCVGHSLEEEWNRKSLPHGRSASNVTGRLDIPPNWVYKYERFKNLLINEMYHTPCKLIAFATLPNEET